VPVLILFARFLQDRHPNNTVSAGRSGLRTEVPVLVLFARFLKNRHLSTLPAHRWSDPSQAIRNRDRRAGVCAFVRMEFAVRVDIAPEMPFHLELA